MIPQSYLRTLSLGNMAVGEQLKFNHAECPAGVDHRGRLYVLRKEPRLWLAYCHNCGEGGAVSTDSHGGLWAETDTVLKSLENYFKGSQEIKDTMTLVSTKLALPADCTFATIAWDAWAHERLWEHFTNGTQVIAPPYRWSFSPSLNQLITPINREGEALCGYQARCSPDRKPKCITTYSPNNKGEPLFYIGKQWPTLFIVEDPLSALRIHQDRDASVMALLGTHLNEVAFVSLLRFVERHGINQIVIWMDDDEAGMKAAHLIFMRVRQQYNQDVKVVVCNMPEAKTLNPTILKGYVT